MALKTSDIEAEITKTETQRVKNDTIIVKAIKKLDKLKAGQQKVVDKLKKLYAARTNINQYNKAG